MELDLYIYLPLFGVSSTLLLFLHQSFTGPCCLVYISHAVLKVRKALAVGIRAVTFFISTTCRAWLRTSVTLHLLPAPLRSTSREAGTVKPLLLENPVIVWSAAEKFYISSQARGQRGLSSRSADSAVVITLLCFGQKSRDTMPSLLGKCQKQKWLLHEQQSTREWINDVLDVTQIWGWWSQSEPEWARREVAHYVLQRPRFTRRGEQSTLDKGRQLTGETSYYEEDFGTVALQSGKQKPLLSSAAGGLFFVLWAFCDG